MTDNRLEARMDQMDTRLQALEIHKATAESDRRHLDLRFDRIEEQQKSIQSYMFRMVWLVIAGIVTAVVRFALGGGFNVST